MTKQSIPPFVSVIVPAFNEEELIGQTLDAIQMAFEASSQAIAGYEVIVCNNNSGDRTAEIARAHGAKVVFEPINQIGRARNTGADAATGDWLLFVDADSVPTAKLISDTLCVISSGRYVGGSSIVQFREAPIWWRAIWALKNRLIQLANLGFGAFIFCRCDAFEEIGGFNTKLYVVEDVDLVLRLKVYARRIGLDFIVLRGDPIFTSARKAHQPIIKLFVPTLWIALTPIMGSHRPSQFAYWYHRESRRSRRA